MLEELKLSNTALSVGRWMGDRQVHGQLCLGERLEALELSNTVLSVGRWMGDCHAQGQLCLGERLEG
jgi:hypothetical protein